MAEVAPAPLLRNAEPPTTVLSEVTDPLSAVPASVDVLVIGAGQAGLSAGYYLARAGLVPGEDFLIVDRGPHTGGAWQHRWEALRLGYAHRVHDLPGMKEMGLSFESADISRPARDVVIEYYRRFEDAYGLAVARPVAVDAVEYRPEGFAATLRTPVAGIAGSRPPADASLIVRSAVVNASGTWGSPFIPDVPGRESFAGRQLHTQQYVSATEFAGERVVVVGGGTSAIGFLVELEGVAASTSWYTRRPVEFADGSALPQEDALRAVAEQDRAARAGEVLPSIVSGTGVPLSARMRSAYEHGLLESQPLFVAVEPEGVRRADGTLDRADVILWATGWRAELGHLAPLELTEPGGGVRVEDGRAVRDPRVFLAGYGPQASTIGANRAGRATARAVLASLY